jgi:hypothetical protein
VVPILPVNDTITSLGEEYQILAYPAKVAIEHIRLKNPEMAARHADRINRLTERA